MSGSHRHLTSGDRLRMTMIPPSPFSAQVNVDVRIAWQGTIGGGDSRVVFELHAGGAATGTLLRTQVYPSGLAAGSLVQFRIPGTALLGHDKLTVTARSDDGTILEVIPIEVLDLETPSTNRLDGAFVGFYHWSETEGRLWNAELKTFEEPDWRELVRAQKELDMNIIVLQESFRNEEYVSRHKIPEQGYRGRAYYPSRLFPGRMEIRTADPIEAVLAEADELGMSVFVPVGMYAWFDFTPGSLQWHKDVADELWERYGHHRSFYGWYVSEEVHGHLGDKEADKENLLAFFEEFSSHCRQLSPEKPVMLAPNCHWIRGESERYRFLLRNLDIICPFGFHRMPAWDQSGEEAADMLQALCSEAGAHLWLDLEAFLFTPDMALSPRPLEQIVTDFRRFPHFEKVVCYQFPGIFNAPWASKKPGGPDTVRLFKEYRQYMREIEGRHSLPAHS